MAAQGTGISAGNRALKSQRRTRRLPQLEVPKVENLGLARALDTIAETFRVYSGESNAPKERFVTVAELEDIGFIKSNVKNGYAYISQVLSKDSAQKAGSTANPTLKGTRIKDTGLGPRAPGGSGGASNPIEQGKRGLVQKLSDIGNVKVQAPAQKDFLYQDGARWINYPLFKKNNVWEARQDFKGGITIDADGAVFDPALYMPLAGGTFTGATHNTSGALSYLGNGTDSMPLYKYRAGASVGGWARGLIYNDAATTTTFGGMGALGSNDSLTQFAMGFGSTWYNGDDGMKLIQGTGFTFNNDVSIPDDQLIVGSGDHVDGHILLRLNTDRPWSFRQEGDAATAALHLYMESTGDKQFKIGSAVDPDAVSIGSESGSITAAGLITAPDFTTTGTGGKMTFAGNGGYFKDNDSSTYAPIMVTGTKGGYGGISFDGAFAWMNNGATQIGLYDDTNNLWMIQANPASSIKLYYNGANKIATTSTGVSVTGRVTASGGTDSASYFQDQNLALVPDGSVASDTVHLYPCVRGGAFNGNNSNETGYCRIRYPTGMTDDSVMHSFWIVGYNYSGTRGDDDGGGWAIMVSGYKYSSENWLNYTARIIYGSPPFDIVRFGEDETGDYAYILLGESTTDWNYPQIVITNLMTGYSNQYDDIGSGNWNIDFSASTPSNWSEDGSGSIYVGGQIRWDGEAGATSANDKSYGGRVTISTSAPSGGDDGDIWFEY